MKIKKNLAETLIYLSAYIGGAAFALVGGLFFLKCKDENIKKPLKIALMLFVVFLGADAVVLILEDLFSAIEIWNTSYCVDLIVDLGKTIVFGLTAFSAFSGGSKEFYELEGFSGEK